jgi:hypothetical protein
LKTSGAKETRREVPAARRMEDWQSKDMWKASFVSSKPLPSDARPPPPPRRNPPPMHPSDVSHVTTRVNIFSRVISRSMILGIVEKRWGSAFRVQGSG